jgi:predicted nucleic acid-binding protein
LTFVVDASVVLKWVLPESQRDEAVAFLDRFESRQIKLIAPTVLSHEVASALARRVRQRLDSVKEAQLAWAEFDLRHPILIDGPELTRAAFALSLEHQLSYWDCLYLALAIAHRCDLITADHRFHRGAVQHYPNVRLL